jgi:hypothetical protein
MLGNGRFAIFLEQAVEGFAQEILNRTVVLQPESTKLARNSGIEVTSYRLFAQSAWRLRARTFFYRGSIRRHIR